MDRVFTVFFSNSVQSDIESQLSGDFLGALVGQQLWVVESSGCRINSQRLLT